MEQISKIESRIFIIRGLQVMLDRDLAELYGVEVKRLNEQVKRNSERFPENFRFQLSDSEFNELVAICDRFKNLKHSSVNSYVFTEAGVAMLSAVLHTPVAIQVSIRIINAFVAMRKLLSSNTGFIQRLETVEIKQIETDKKIDTLFKAWENKEAIPKCGVFFDGQIFDAYVLANNIIKSAKKSIVLIDNYVDETVLTLLSNRVSGVSAKIYTAQISPQLQLALQKHAAQYPPITVKKFSKSHDRFLLIDGDTYHIGASLKDLGKRWFAFSKIEPEGLNLLNKLP